jgi:hypothetical protein
MGLRGRVAPLFRDAARLTAPGIDDCVGHADGDEASRHPRARAQ